MVVVPRGRGCGGGTLLASAARCQAPSQRRPLARGAAMRRTWFMGAVAAIVALLALPSAASATGFGHHPLRHLWRQTHPGRGGRVAGVGAVRPGAGGRRRGRRLRRRDLHVTRQLLCSRPGRRCTRPPSTRRPTGQLSSTATGLVARPPSWSAKRKVPCHAPARRRIPPLTGPPSRRRRPRSPAPV